MGQLQSCSTTNDFNIHKQALSKKKIKFAQEVASHLQNNPNKNKTNCLYTLCHFDINLKNDSWKEFLVKKFKESTSKKWPRILERIIKPYKIDKADTKNQADILWIFYNHKGNTEEQVFEKVKKIADGGVAKERNMNSYYEDNSVIAMKTPQKYVGSEIGPDSNDKQETCEGFTGSSKPKRNDDELNISVTGFQESDTSFESCKAEEEEEDSLAKMRYSQYENYSVLSANQSGFGGSILPQCAQENMKKYRLAFAMIDQQLKQKDNIFGRMISEFEKCFCKRYRETAFDGVILKKKAAEATKDIQEFISMMSDAIIQYYFLEKIKKDQNSSLLTRDNLIGFVTSIVFSGELYKTIFDLFCSQEMVIEERYQKNIEVLKSKNPEDFGVPHEYCLNMKTLNHFKKPNGEDENQKLHDINGKAYNAQKPYREAVAQLKKLGNISSPTQKLKILAKVVKLINKSTEKFYKRFDLECGRKLDPDETLSLFVYLLARSELKNISVHYRIIEKFSTNNILNSISGYYAVTLQAAMDYICSLAPQV